MDISEQIRTRIAELKGIQANAEKEYARLPSIINGCLGAVAELGALLKKIEEGEQPPAEPKG